MDVSDHVFCSVCDALMQMDPRTHTRRFSYAAATKAVRRVTAGFGRCGVRRNDDHIEKVQFDCFYRLAFLLCSAEEKQGTEVHPAYATVSKHDIVGAAVALCQDGYPKDLVDDVVARVTAGFSHCGHSSERSAGSNPRHAKLIYEHARACCEASAPNVRTRKKLGDGSALFAYECAELCAAVAQAPTLEDVRASLERMASVEDLTRKLLMYVGAQVEAASDAAFKEAELAAARLSILIIALCTSRRAVGSFGDVELLNVEPLTSAPDKQLCQYFALAVAYAASAKGIIITQRDRSVKLDLLREFDEESMASHAFDEKLLTALKQSALRVGLLCFLQRPDSATSGALPGYLAADGIAQSPWGERLAAATRSS